LTTSSRRSARLAGLSVVAAGLLMMLALTVLSATELIAAPLTPVEDLARTNVTAQRAESAATRAP
jgi:hypothetical protein